uniref:Maturase K n=1 Tax=Peracarpa carnosa var. circaeoides TaxID=1051076 RepID=M1KWJ3_9ASTR|nr:maturase K [Peracarpa carnosa var. circaeoides]
MNNLYLLMFQEFVYAFAHDYALSEYTFGETVSYDKKFSLLIVKRLIPRMYDPNYWIHSTNDCKQKPFFERSNNLESQIISEAFAAILASPFRRIFREMRKNTRENRRNDFINFRSMHSVFPFLEDNISHLDYVLDIKIPYPIHPEILVQNIRLWVKDTWSLHLLRFFLHEFSLITSKILLLPIYSHVCEYESIFVFLRNQSSHLRSTSSRALGERIYFYGKIEHLGEVLSRAFQGNLWIFTDSSMHYVRYQGKSILVSKGTSLVMNKWKYYFVNLWQSYFYLWSQPRRIHINQLSNHSLDFLAYFSSVRRSTSTVRNQMLAKLFLSENAIKKFETFVPIIPLIGALAQRNFCNRAGYPSSKAFWLDLSDFEIIERSAGLYRTLALYYSGCSKKKSLSRIKYILQLSCAKTLARKHKSTVRAVSKRFGSELEEFFTVKELISFNSFHFPGAASISRSFYNERVWLLDILYTLYLDKYK